MGKPVDKTNFWRERIRQAKEAGKERYSVYLTSQNDWDKLNEVHKQIIKKHISRDDSVLDAGCGYGRASEWFRNYHGIDFSPDFIAMAQKMYPNKTFSVADLTALTFNNKEFDWGICISIKQMIVANLGAEKWALMEKELRRVCQKVLILEYSDPDKYEIV